MIPVTTYTYQFIALDGNGSPAPYAVGSLYAPDDTAFATPLTVTDQDGTVGTTVTARQLGIVTFTVVDVIRGRWKSGSTPSMEVQAWEAADAAAAAAATSQAAAEAAQAAAEVAATHTTEPTAAAVRTVFTTDIVDPTTVIATAVNGAVATAVAPIAPDNGGRAIGKVSGLIANDSTSTTKAANAAILAAALTTGASVNIPLGTFYTNEVALVGPVTIAGAGRTLTTLRNDAGTVFTVSGTEINVSKMTLRSDGGNHTVRQVGGVDQCHWTDFRLWQSSPSFSAWSNTTAGRWVIANEFTNFVLWHVQTATVPTWNIVQAGDTVNDNVWEEFWVEYSGNYSFWVESTDGNSHYGNVWRNAVWEVCTGGMIKLIGCRDYLIDNGRLWDLSAGLGGITTLKKNGIHVDTNASNALAMGTIKRQARLDSTCDAGVYDLVLPGPGSLGFGLGYGTIIEDCRNISNSNPYLVDLRTNECLIINPSSGGATLTTYANPLAAQFIDKAGVSLPASQAFKVGTDTVIGFGIKATVTADPASIAAGAEADVTLTVTGAAVGDACTATPTTMIESGLAIICCAVTATNTVKVRLRNNSASAIDPASRSWVVRVWH
jgi:hypothetical protein